MTDEAKEARRAYQRVYKREWRKRNPGKDKEYEERRWEKVAQSGQQNKEQPHEKDT